MKTGKTSAATLGLLGGLALVAWIGTEVKMNRDTAPEPAPITAAAAEEPAATTAPARPKRVTRVVRAASSTAAETPTS